MSAEPATLQALQRRIGRRFRDPALLVEALSHASAGEGRAGTVSNERLEFLGDRVLGLIMAERMFQRFPEVGESGLAPRYNALVNRAACARAARACGLSDALILSKAEAQSGGRDKEAILADACEALIAALYLDGGMKAAARFVERFWGEAFEAVVIAPTDPKTALQEWAARARRGVPAYALVGREGPDHAPEFLVEARVEGLTPRRASAGSKREAERAAAQAVLKDLGLA